jgi:hypothetical protein
MKKTKSSSSSPSTSSSSPAPPSSSSSSSSCRIQQQRFSYVEDLSTSKTNSKLICSICSTALWILSKLLANIDFVRRALKIGWCTTRNAPVPVATLHCRWNNSDHSLDSMSYSILSMSTVRMSLTNDAPRKTPLDARDEVI